MIKASTRKDGFYDLQVELDPDGPTYCLRHASWEEVANFMTRFAEGENFSHIIDSWEIEKPPFIVKLINILLVLILITPVILGLIALVMAVVFLTGIITS